MTAKPKTRTSGAPRTSASKEATELLVLLSGILIGLKRQPGGGGPKEHDELGKAFEKSDLGERHVGPLLALVLSGPASVSELANRIGLTPATTSLLVGELSRAGFVERREDEADRRRTIVSVASPIEEVVRPALDQTLAPIAKGLGRMSASQRTQVMDGLRILNEELRRAKGNGSR